MLEGNGSTPELRAALQRQDAPRVYPAVVSVGSAIPPGRLTNAEISERLGISEEWIVSRTGVHERPIAGPDDRLTEYAARAATQALAGAGLRTGGCGPRDRRDPDPGRDPAERGSSGRVRAGRHTRRRRRRRRRLHGVPLGRVARRLPDRERPGSQRGRRRRRLRDLPRRQLGRQALPAAVRRRRRGGRAHALERWLRRDRADRARVRRLARQDDRRRPRDAALHGRPGGLPSRRRANGRVHDCRGGAGGTDARRTSTCSSTTRPTRGSRARSATASGWIRRRSWT